MNSNGRLTTKIVTIVGLLVLGLVVSWGSVQAACAWGLGILAGVSLMARSEFFSDWNAHGK